MDSCVKKYELKLDGISYSFENNNVSVSIQLGVHSVSINTVLADGYTTQSWSQIYTTKPGEKKFL